MHIAPGTVVATAMDIADNDILPLDVPSINSVSTDKDEAKTEPQLNQLTPEEARQIAKQLGITLGLL